MSSASTELRIVVSSKSLACRRKKVENRILSKQKFGLSSRTSRIGSMYCFQSTVCPLFSCSIRGPISSTILVMSALLNLSRSYNSLSSYRSNGWVVTIISCPSCIRVSFPFGKCLWLCQEQKLFQVKNTFF